MKQNVILITGTSSGIGKACAEYLTGMGHAVYGTRRRINPVDNSQDKYSLLKMDVTDESAVKQGINRIIKEKGRIDVVINNAGIGHASPIEFTTMDEVEFLLNTNFKGYLRVIRAVLPFMRKEMSGLIINISSMLGVFTIPFQGIYNACKFAIEGLTECLSMEVKPFGIKTVLIEPGDVLSQFIRNRLRNEIDPLGTVYNDRFKKASEVFIEDERNGIKAMNVARLATGIIGKKNPRLRYSIGNPLQKLGIVLHKILPNRWFERIFMGFYKQN